MRLLLLLLIVLAGIFALWGMVMLWTAWKQPGAGSKLGWALVGTAVFLAGSAWVMDLWGVLDAT